MNRNDLRRQMMRHGRMKDTRRRRKHTLKVVPSALTLMPGRWIEDPRNPGRWIYRLGPREHVYVDDVRTGPLPRSRSRRRGPRRAARAAGA